MRSGFQLFCVPGFSIPAFRRSGVPALSIPTFRVSVQADSVRMAIHFFVNFDVFKRLYLAYLWDYLHQTWGFCKAWSALYDYVDQQLLIPRSRFETRQWRSEPEKVKYMLQINEWLSCSCDRFWEPSRTMQGTTECTVQLIVIWSGFVDHSGIY